MLTIQLQICFYLFFPPIRSEENITQKSDIVSNQTEWANTVINNKN